MRVCIVGCGAVGSLFAANLGDARRRRGLGLRPRRASTSTAINRDGLRLTGAGEVVGQVSATTDAARAARRATSGSSRRRRCTPRRRSPPPPTRSPTAPSRPSRTGSATRRCSPRHVERVIRGTTFPAGKILEPGRRPVGRQGRRRRSARSSRSRRAIAEIERLADACTRGGHADRRRRRRARPAVAQGDLQRRDEPARRADRAHARRASASSPPLRALASRLVDEGKAVAAAQGIELDSDPEELIDYAARPEVAYGHKASMLQDVEARRQTEVDYLNGGIVGVRAPLRRADARARGDLGARERGGGSRGRSEPDRPGRGGRAPLPLTRARRSSATASTPRSSAGSEYTGFEGAVTYLSGFVIVHRYAYVLLPARGRSRDRLPERGPLRRRARHDLDRRAGVRRPPGRVARRPRSAASASASTGSTTR